MFISELSDQQQQVLINLAFHVMFADGQLDESELNLLENLKSQCRQKVMQQGADMSELTEQFVNHKDKIALMLELVMVVMADEVCHEAEIFVLDDIAKRINVSEKQLDECKLWVKQYTKLQEQAKALMKG